MSDSPIRRAIESAGGQTALAQAIGVSQGMVWQWVTGRRRISAERCGDIERATNGAVTRADLRPDLWGEEAEQVA